MPRVESPLGDAIFLPLNQREINVAQQFGVRPLHTNYCCGMCGKETQGRIVCLMTRKHDNQSILWCVCSCEKQEPTILIEDGTQKMTFQTPLAIDFEVESSWPVELAQLYEEASKSFSAGAHTACAMVCRKLLMATACEQGDSDGKKFAEYVTYITDTVLTYPKAKSSIDQIRTIGNEANHNVAFVNPDDARRAMKIVTYMLRSIYSLPDHNP